MVTLTRDNHAAVLGASQDGLAGVNSSYGKHLVVVRQMSNWDAANKQFVATPSETKYCQGWSCGIEDYASQHGGTQVLNDTNILINNVKNSIDAQSWKSGESALFQVSSRSRGPYAWYQYYQHYSPNRGNVNNISEFGASVVAYKFNLKHLHFSKMGNDFSAYLRVWAGSQLEYDPTIGSSDGIMMVSPLWGDCSKLRMKFFTTLPTLAWNVADNGDSFEFYGNSNNGITVTSYTLLQDKACSYTPFNNLPCAGNVGNSARIFTLQDATQSGQTPTDYYHDFQITNTGNLDFLKNNPGEMWAVAHFHMGNAFTDGRLDVGLNPAHACTVFAERVELVIKPTCSAFNNN